MITKQMKQQQTMMTALITILLAVFGSIMNAVGGVTVTPSAVWDDATRTMKLDGKFVTVKVDNAGEFAAYLNDSKNQFVNDYKDITTFVYTGKANSADLAVLNKLTNKQINLSKLVIDDSNLSTSEDKIKAFNAIKLNAKAEYLALPDAGAELASHDDQLFKELRDNNTNLKGVSYYYKDGKSLTCYSTNPGDVYLLTFMSFCGTWDNGASYHKENSSIYPLENLKVSGNLNAKDISYPGSNKYDKYGHYAFTDEFFPEDHDKCRTFVENPTGDNANAAFDGTSVCLKKLDLQDANFEKPEDMTLAFSGLLGASTETVIIPTSINELPADFLHINGGNNIKSICIPYNIEKIGYRAFYGLNNLNHVTTTDKDGKLIDYGFGLKKEIKDVNVNGKTYKEQIVTDSTVTDPSSGTIVFSDNLKEIDSWAFASIYRVKDVYNRATTAPICHVNAFGSEPYCGNNGFQPYGGITRDDYRKGDAESRWIIMLHYPTAVHGTDEEKRYTDVTRDYTITDAEGHTDKWGNVLHWPNQSEFSRAYEQATNGYLWKAWGTEREAWSNLGSYSLKEGDGGYQMTQKTANEFYSKNGSPANTTFYHTAVDGGEDTDNGAFAKVTMSDGKTPLYGNNDYRGWHQFVLATPSDGNDTPSHNFGYINDNGWWTICVPFDMTKEEVKEMFAYRKKEGTYGNPHVCEFTGVLRDADYTGNPNTELKGKIVLKFDRDVYNYVYNKTDGTTVDRPTNDDDVVIKAGVPYLLQPDFEVESDGSLYYYPAQQVLKSEKCGALKSSKLQELAKNNVVEVTAVDGQNNTLDNYKYTFVGSFWQSEMPGFAYFLAWYENGKVATFFWQEKQPVGTMNWNPYTSIIGCNWAKANRQIYVPTGLGNMHWFTRVGNAETGASVFTDDSFTTTGKAKANGPENVSIEAAGNTADGITKVHFGDRTIDIFHGRVYNLNGQYVGDSLDGLPKGIYIAAGKKYVVK